MTRRGARGKLSACAAVVVTLLAAACSGGGSHVSVGPRATDSPNSSETSSTEASSSSTSPTTKHKTKETSASHPSASSVTTSVTVAVAPLVLPLGDTTTLPAPSPVTSGPTPTTAPRTTTTQPGPRPYDPTKPIDLGGEPGVTPAEQARAEKLVRETLRDLPKYAKTSVAYAAGFRSIGDAVTGDEHYVNWAYVNDGRILNSKYPESLVYEVRNGKKTLVSAMYSLPLGSTFADVPDVGGALTQWHVHNDLCLADDPSDPLRKLVSTITSVDGDCPPGTTKAGSSPMLHVWIVANYCGPFAALEGIGAGQVPPGEKHLCDRGHGSG